MTSIQNRNNKEKQNSFLLIVLNVVVVISMAGEIVCTFLPENAGIPGQHGLQQHRCISLRLIATQVVLEFSGKHTEALSSYENMRGTSTGSNKFIYFLTAQSPTRSESNVQTVDVYFLFCT